MDSLGQPTRPPRVGTRGSSAKDPSAGLLMNVIRNFTVSRDVADRDREKQVLEREFKESDRRLEQLVLTHHQDLTAVLQAFRKISGYLKSAKERVRSNREKLLLAQKLLDCKREELRKLWLESVENKQILDLMAAVESLIKVPEEVANHLSKKHYLHATELLIQSISTLESYLSGVEALKELKGDLVAKREELFELLADELHRHIYQRSTQEVIKKFRRSGAERRPFGSTNKHSSNILSASVGSSAIRRRHSSGMQVALADVDEDINSDVDPEDDSRHFIVIILQSFAKLNKLPELIELIKTRCDSELINIIKRTGKELLGDISRPDATHAVKPTIGDMASEQGDGPLLQDFVDLLHQQLVAVVSVHENVVLPHLRRLVETRPSGSQPIEFYSIGDVREKIKSVLQLISDLYLDMSATDTSIEKNHGANMTEDANGADISSYFVKKRVLGIGQVGGFGKMKKSPLFRFDQSSHAMSLNAYFEEKREESEPRFQLTEYVQLVQLLHRSLPGRDPSHLEANMKKLTEILDELAESI